jgi:predicted esterase
MTTFPPDFTPAVSVTKDVIYATSLEDGGSDWTLDVYTPIEPGDGPIVILLHGLGANKEGYSRESEIIAENGATVYTVNWPIVAVDIATLDNGRGFREISESLNCAIFFMRANTTDIGGDSSHVILIGHSYGALYGAWITLASDAVDTQWEDAELWEIVSPYANFGRNSEVSFRLLHGEQDTLAKPESSQNFNDLLLEAGYDSRVILFDGRHIVPPQLTYETVIELANE